MEFRWLVVAMLCLTAVKEASRLVLVFRGNVSRSWTWRLARSPLAPAATWWRTSYFEEVLFWKETVADICHEIVFEGILGSMPQLVLELWYYLMIVQTGLDWILQYRSVVLWVWGCVRLYREDSATVQGLVRSEAQLSLLVNEDTSAYIHCLTRCGCHLDYFVSET